MKKLTTEEFVCRAKEAHGDKYDYSECEYINSNSKLKIFCKSCNNFFMQTPYVHWKGHGCQKCGLTSRSESRVVGTEPFIKKAIDVHGDRYDYSKVEYVNCKKKVDIFCKQCQEYFYQTPDLHLSGRGCKKCGTRTTKDKLSLGLDTFLSRAMEIHKNKYDYALVDYSNINTKVSIICPNHGVFKQSPDAHLAGKNCPKCSNEKYGRNTRLTTKEFIERSKSVHGEKYNYSHVNYTNSSIKIKIICNKHNKCFYQAPSCHLSGAGCPDCAKEKTSIFTRTGLRDAMHRNGGVGDLYLIRCFNENEEFYKIGVTSRGVSDRFESKTKMPYNYEVVSLVSSGNSDFIFDSEIYIKRMIRNYRYQPKIEFAGMTECFDPDVIESVLKEFEKISEQAH